MTTMTFRKVRSDSEFSDSSIKVTLFRDRRSRVCGWYLGPVRIETGSVVVPYLPRSECVRASVAIVRALAEAAESGVTICIVDPEDLWETAWAG